MDWFAIAPIDVLEIIGTLIGLIFLYERHCIRFLLMVVKATATSTQDKTHRHTYMQHHYGEFHQKTQETCQLSHNHIHKVF
jgi:hypothetical protein